MNCNYRRAATLCPPKNMACFWYTIVNTLHKNNNNNNNNNNSMGMEEVIPL
jgi:hypothetical protein